MKNDLLIRQSMISNTSSLSTSKIAVIIPCYNEALAITSVIAEARAVLPESVIYVFNNNSTDDTKKLALAAGAVVMDVSKKGKGYVVRRMFADVDSDIYLLVDGDATYDLSTARELIHRLQVDKLDMVVGCRIDDKLDSKTYRFGHRFGNKILTKSVSSIFGDGFSDMLSGYRIFSKRFVKSFPTASKGFEIETELTVHALELCMPCAEIQVKYRSRPDGSVSKLATYSDGFKILLMIIRLSVTERPLFFFLSMSCLLMFTSVLISIPLVITYLETGLVPRFPTAILSTGLVILSALSAVCGLILNTVTIGRQELKRLHYISIASTHHLKN